MDTYIDSLANNMSRYHIIFKNSQLTVLIDVVKTLAEATRMAAIYADLHPHIGGNINVYLRGPGSDQHDEILLTLKCKNENDNSN